MTIDLTPSELELLVSALDSHVYWQLSDERYRDSGFVDDPGSDDEEQAAEIIQSRTLETKLQKALTAALPEVLL